MIVIPIVINALWMIPKRLEREMEEMEIRGRIETVKTLTESNKEPSMVRESYSYFHLSSFFPRLFLFAYGYIENE